MKRIEIIYDGHPYSMAGTDLDELKAQILSVAETGEAVWLTVNEGEGTVRPVDLLINASTRISVAGIVAED